MTDESRQPQVLACQHGARHRYAVPRMLEQAGMLAALYTDSSTYSFLGKCATLFGTRAPQAIKRLAGREIRGVSRSKIFSFDGYNFYEFGQKFMGLKKQGIYRFRQRSRLLSRTMQKRGLQGADVVYSMFHENLDFIHWAKAQGRCIAVDVFLGPQTNQVMKVEFTDFPDWGENPEEAIIRLEEQMWKDSIELADILICPSEWVAEGVRTLSPASSGKICIVPYGCSIDYSGRTNQPVQGRILFAGGYALRKGLRYLAQAATQLKDSNPEIDIRIAGMLPPAVVNHPICKDLNFLGKLGGEQIKAEYLAADCFVLPSLSEGFAGVVAEAISAGCPVIVTPESGSPIVDGREGLIIPSRNTDALVEAIQRIVTDRDLRNHCAKECLKQASIYTEKEWGARLTKAISSGAAPFMS